ncbi:GTP-binding protein [Streptomyces tendae]|uniref:GTP-binding protein n=1 Tax=Streptomyces tendae TaxID=1932 RepID=UPI00379E88BE
MGTTTISKVVVIGDGGVGKTTFLNKVGVPAKGKYVSSHGAQVVPVYMTTNIGDIEFQCWDTAGQEKFGGLRDGFFIQTTGVILMFDVTSLASYQALPAWYEQVERVSDGDVFSAVVVGNKADAQERAVSADRLTFHLDKGLPYCEVSALAGTNLGEPFIWLARDLTGRRDMALVP